MSSQEPVDNQVTQRGGPDAAPLTPPNPASLDESTAATRPLSFDALVEQMAHMMAYQDALDPEQEALLRQYGYQTECIVTGEHDFQMRLFMPSLSEFPHPVVAFRGTDSGRDVLSDVNPHGIGMDQLRLNRAIIEANMAFAAGRGPLVVTGHSLGGALAQMAAVAYPGLVFTVITFESPGIPRELVAELDAYNTRIRTRTRGGGGIPSTHYRVEGDVVPHGGAALTSGVIRNYSYHGGTAGWGEGRWLAGTPRLQAAVSTPDHALGAHKAMPLAAADLHGAAVPGVYTVAGQSVEYLGETSTDENNSQVRVLDPLREKMDRRHRKHEHSD